MSKATFRSNARALEKLFQNAVASGMERAQLRYLADMRKTLSQSPHGRYYKNAGTPFWYDVAGPGPGVHRASAPGEPPAAFSGFLRDSTKSAQVSLTPGRYVGAVYTSAPYAALLEFGGVNKEGHRVEPRPAWLPTLLFNRREYFRAAVSGLQEAMRRR